MTTREASTCDPPPTCVPFRLFDQSAGTRRSSSTRRGRAAEDESTARRSWHRLSGSFKRIFKESNSASLESTMVEGGRPMITPSSSPKSHIAKFLAHSSSAKGTVSEHGSTMASPQRLDSFYSKFNISDHGSAVASPRWVGSPIESFYEGGWPDLDDIGGQSKNRDVSPFSEAIAQRGHNASNASIEGDILYTAARHDLR